MGRLWNSISAVLLILMMIGAGYIFGLLGWMKSEHKGLVTKFIINLAVPCLCIKNVLENFTREALASSGKTLLMLLLYNIAATLVSVAAAKLLRISKKRFGGFVSMCAFSNSIFIGYPVCLELFGESSVPYMMLFYLLNTISFWTIGAHLIYRSGDAGRKLTPLESIKHIASPPFVALIIAGALVLLDFQLPHILSSFCSYMSNAVTPLALLYVGFVMYETGFKEMKPDPGMWAMCAMRFLIAPAMMVGFIFLFGLPRELGIVLLVESAMPSMTQSVVVSGLAGADERYNAIGLSLTTVMCLVVIPVIMLVAS